MPTRRLLIDVRPRLFATSLARALHGGQYEVLVVDALHASATLGTVDVAITSERSRGHLDAPVVVSLPDQEGGEGDAIVWRNGAAESVPIRTMTDFAALLDSLAPA